MSDDVRQLRCDVARLAVQLDDVQASLRAILAALGTRATPRDDRAALADLLAAWTAFYGDAARCAVDVIADCRGAGGRARQALAAVLEGLGIELDGEEAVDQLGALLRRLAGVAVEGRALVKDKRVAAGRCYRVLDVE